MARYIDANKLQERLTLIVNEPDYQHEGENWSVGVCLAGLQIDDMPTEDVQEVKHGKWKQIEDTLGWQEVRCAECSVCGEDWIIEEDYSFEDFTEYWRYCPNCGAKMDGGKNG